MRCGLLGLIVKSIQLEANCGLIFFYSIQSSLKNIDRFCYKLLRLNDLTLFAQLLQK